jgi:hypothetical protein
LAATVQAAGGIEVKSVTNGYPLPVTNLWEAVNYLLALDKQGILLHGDIKKASEKFKVDYASLRQRWHRNHELRHPNTLGGKRVSSVTNPQSFNSHGYLKYSTLVLNESYIERLPVCKLTRWKTPFWFGIVHNDFTMQVFPSGRSDVFLKTMDGRRSLEAELLKVWDPQAVSSFLKCLQVNGAKLELAIAIPGIPVGQHYTDKNGLVDITTDHTPKEGGNVEIKVNIGEFDKRLASLEKSIHNIPTQLGGGMHFVTTLSNMMAVIDKHAERIYSLEKLSVVNGLNSPSLNTVGDSPPKASESLSKDSAGSAGVLSSHSPPVFSGTTQASIAIQLPETAGAGKGEPSETSLDVERSPDRPRYCPRLKEHDNYLFCRGTILKREDGTETPAGELLLPTCAGAYENCRWYK